MALVTLQANYAMNTDTLPSTSFVVDNTTKPVWDRQLLGCAKC